MSGANDFERDRVPGGEDGSPDPLAPLLEVLVSTAGLPGPEIARRVREALPSAVAEVADSNRRLREATFQREALVAAAAVELRAAADVLEASDGVGGHEEEVARLRRVAEDLERALRAPREAPSRDRPAQTPVGRPRILVADDEGDARDILVTILQTEYEVQAVADGEHAVERIRTEHPDLVLMDLYMPRLDGLQALERIRSDPATADIPVIFVSAGADDTVKARAFELGAVDYLQKPFSDRELRARVERTVRLARSQTALRELAQTDPLTGLANLRAFRARLEDEVKRARRYGTPLTAIMTDMDYLKPINDDLGHAAGDRAIAAVAAVIRAELRETDFGARYGGDEFVILLPHTSRDEGRVLAERICGRLKQTSIDVAGRSVSLGASFGVACMPENAEMAADALVAEADAALYRAKRSGRGRVAVAPPIAEPTPREHA